MCRQSTQKRLCVTTRASSCRYKGLRGMEGLEGDEEAGGCNGVGSDDGDDVGREVAVREVVAGAAWEDEGKK